MHDAFKRNFQNTSPENTAAGKRTAGDDAKETEALAGRFGINKKCVHKKETEVSGKCSKIFWEERKSLQRSVLENFLPKLSLKACRLRYQHPEKQPDVPSKNNYKT